jgi:hypothetical protein
VRVGAEPGVTAVEASANVGVVVVQDDVFARRVEGKRIIVGSRSFMGTVSALGLMRDPATSRMGVAWVMMWIALAVHVTDEALTGFLSVYNPTVVALREKLGFWPMPTFGFREWLGGLTAGIFLLAVLSPFAFRNARWIRPLFYFVAVVTGIFNALGHTLVTIFGQTVSTVRFPRPAPGFYSSPLLLVVSMRWCNSGGRAGTSKRITYERKRLHWQAEKTYRQGASGRTWPGQSALERIGF